MLKIGAQSNVLVNAINRIVFGLPGKIIIPLKVNLPAFANSEPFHVYQSKITVI
jgi:hypothetical protein